MTLTNKQVRELFALSSEWFDTFKAAAERIINEQEEPCKCGGSCSGNCHHDEAEEEPEVFITNMPMPEVVDVQRTGKIAPQDAEKAVDDKLPNEPKTEAETDDLKKAKKRKTGTKEYPNFYKKPSDLTDDQLGTVYALYSAGWSVPKIADEMRLEPRSAHFAIDRALAYMKNRKEEPEVTEDEEDNAEV